MPAGCRECSPAEEYEGEQPSCFFIYFISPPAPSVSPLDHDKVTDLDLEKNAHRIFPYLLLRNFLFFVASQVFLFRLRRPAFRRWTTTRSRTLTSRKMLIAFFRIMYSLTPPFSHSNVLIFCKALPKRHSFANPGDSAKSFSGVEFQTLRLYLNRMKQK